jgi:uncharacterized membrane protein YGL010W
MCWVSFLIGLVVVMCWVSFSIGLVVVMCLVSFPIGPSIYTRRNGGPVDGLHQT